MEENICKSSSQSVGSLGRLTLGTSGPARLRASADEAKAETLSVPWSSPSRGITESLSLPAILLY